MKQREVALSGSRKLRPYENLERDIFAVLTKTVVVGQFWVDLHEAERFLLRVRDAGGLRLSMTHLLIKASAQAVMASPRMHRMYGVFRALDPEQADVSVSVAGREMLPPSVLIAAADRKPLMEIARELRAGAREALRRQNRIVQSLGPLNLVRFLPGPLRRLLLRAFLSNPRRRRAKFGTIHFSSDERFDVEIAHVPVLTDLLVLVGGIHKRPHEDDQQRVFFRSGTLVAVHGDHLKLNGITGAEFINKFREVMEHPEQLL